MDTIVATKNDSAEWIETIEYSPDGSKLAVGSHDNNIYVYNSSTYELLGVCKAHNSFIVSVDWSTDGTYLRSVCGAHELLFFTAEDLKQDPSGGSNTWTRLGRLARPGTGGRLRGYTHRGLTAPISMELSSARGATWWLLGTITDWSICLGTRRGLGRSL